MKRLVFAAALLGLSTSVVAKPTEAMKPKIGAVVIGKDNKDAGIIAQVTETAVVIDTGTSKVPVTPASIGSNPKGLWIGMTKAELDASYAQSAQQAQASFAARLMPGKTVQGMNGAILGTIKLADAQFVTLTTDKGDVRLPVSGFGPGPDDSVVVGLTREQLDAAITGATPTQ